MFRLFGSPYTSGFHQCLTYLRLKRRYPYKLYCSGYLTTILYATFYKSRTMGVQTPELLYGPIRVCGEEACTSTTNRGHTGPTSSSLPEQHDGKTGETAMPMTCSPSSSLAPVRHGVGHTVCHVWDVEEVVERYEAREQRVWERFQAWYREEMRRKVHVVEPSSSSSDGKGDGDCSEENQAKGSHGGPGLSFSNESKDAQNRGEGSQKKGSDEEMEKSLESTFLAIPRSSAKRSSSLMASPAASLSSSSTSGTSSRTQIPFHSLFSDLPSGCGSPPHFYPLRLHYKTHPRLHQLQWALSLYIYWWLGKTSLLYRFVISEGREVIAGLLYYFLMIPTGGKTMTHLVAPFAKKAIGGPLASTGVCEATSPYMMAHFRLLVRYLEAHFAFQAEEDAARAEEEALTEVHWGEVTQTEMRQRLQQKMREGPPTNTSPSVHGEDGSERVDGRPRGPCGHRSSTSSSSCSSSPNTAAEREAEAGPIRLQSRFLLGTPHPLLCDVLLGAVFSSVFLMDDPPASFLLCGEDPSQHCPYLVNYVQRVTGWKGEWLPEEREGGEDITAATGTAGGVGPGATSFSSSAFPDVIPERLLGVLELIEEVLPFLLSQVASLRAFMSDGQGWMKLSPYTVDDGLWEGCQGRILPALTPLESLMMVDDCLLTVRSRAFDLELALKAGEALQACPHASTASPSSSSPLEQKRAPPPVLHASHAEEAPESSSSSSFSAPGSCPPAAAASTATTAHRVFTNDATEELLQTSARTTHEDPSRCPPPPSRSTSLTAWTSDGQPSQGLQENGTPTGKEVQLQQDHHPSVSDDTTREPGVMDPEDADFYRAFTNSIRHRDRVLQRKAAATAMVEAAAKARGTSLPHRRTTPMTALTPAATSAVSSSFSLPSIEERLQHVFQRVTSTIRQMHCPNYTIATVPYKRRYVSVIIPEHEACRARERRNQEDREAEEWAVREWMKKAKGKE